MLPGTREEGRSQSRHRDLCVLTTTPNPLVATINHERMSVLLTREEEFQTWLNGTPDEAFALTREYPADRMAVVQEG